MSFVVDGLNAKDLISTPVEEKNNYPSFVDQYDIYLTRTHLIIDK